MWLFFFFFFFKQKTAYEILTCDWSSDVCSSDLKHVGWALIHRFFSVWHKQYDSVSSAVGFEFHCLT